MRQFSLIYSISCFCVLLATGIASSAQGILRLHPANSRYVEFRGKPTVLIGSTEHYGAVINLDFDYIKYLDETRACNLNVIRIFSGAYIEVEGAFNIEDNTLAPKPGRFIAPWARSDVPGASDGGNKFDLTRWDPAYFHRLRDLAKEASKRDIMVELTLFCPFYPINSTRLEDLWNASPMKSSNNINNVGNGDRNSCYQTNSDLLPFHLALARKCAQELAGFDNTYLEIINEPYQPTANPVPMAWQNLIINELVAAEPDASKRLLIAQNIANDEGTITNPNPAISIFNFHYATPNAALANLGLNKMIGNDETGFAGPADLAYRQECWLFMLAGGGLVNHLDFGFTPDREDGIASPIAPGGGGPSLRRQLGILRWFLEELPFTQCTPQTSFVTAGIPSGGKVQVFGVPGEAYGLYLSGGSQASLTVNLPAGDYSGRWIDTRSGQTAESIGNFSHPGGTRSLVSPSYRDDISMLLFRSDLSRPQLSISSPHYQSVIGRDAAINIEAAVVVPNGQLERVEFYQNGEALGSDTDPPFSLSLPPMKKGFHILRARALTTDGRESWSPPVKCLVTGLSETGLNLNGVATMVNGKSWQSNTEALNSGMQLALTSPLTSSQNLSVYPPLDSPAALLVNTQFLRNSSSGNPEMTVSYPLVPGEYDVFIKLIESQVANSRDMNIRIEGLQVAKGIGDLSLGEWVNYGPYRTTITDGSLNIGLSRASKGTPKIAGVSVYQADAVTPVSEARLDIGSGAGVAVLSVPANVPLDRIEASLTLDETADWQPIAHPFADFGDRIEITVPADEPRRFFRLRVN